MSSQDRAILDWIARAPRAKLVEWLREEGLDVEPWLQTDIVRAQASDWVQSRLVALPGTSASQEAQPTRERPVSEEVVLPPLSSAEEGAVLYRHPLGEGWSPVRVPHRGGRPLPRGPTLNPLGPGSSGEESDSSVQSRGPPSRAKRGPPSRRGTEEEARRRTPAAPARETRSKLHWASEADMAAHYYDREEERRPMRRRRSHRPGPQPEDRPSPASYWELEVHRDDYHSDYRGCPPAPRKRRERAEDVHRPPSPPTGYPSGLRSWPVHPAPTVSPPAPLPHSLLRRQRDLEEARLEEERRLGEVQERLWRLQLDAVTRPSGPTEAVVPFEVGQGRVSSDSSLLGNQGYLVQPWAEGEDLQEFLELFDSVYAAWDLPVEEQGQTLCDLLTGRPREALLGVPSHYLTDYTTVRDILRAECALPDTLSPGAVSGPSTTAPLESACTGKATVDMAEQSSGPHVATGNVKCNVVLVQSAASSPAHHLVTETAKLHDVCILAGDPGPNGKGVLESYDNDVGHLDVARFSPNSTVERGCNSVVSQALAESSLVPDSVTELRNCNVVLVQEAGSSSDHRGVSEFACPVSLITGAPRGSPRNVKCNYVSEHVPLFGTSACNTAHDVTLCTEGLGPQEVSSSQRASATKEHSEPTLENVMICYVEPPMAVKQGCSQGGGGVSSEEYRGDPVPSTGPCEPASPPSKKVVASALAPQVYCVEPSTALEMSVSNVGFLTGAKSGLFHDVAPEGSNMHDVFSLGLAASSLGPSVIVASLKCDVFPFTKADPVLGGTVVLGVGDSSVNPFNVAKASPECESPNDPSDCNVGLCNAVPRGPMCNVAFESSDCNGKSVSVTGASPLYHDQYDVVCAVFTMPGPRAIDMCKVGLRAAGILGSPDQRIVFEILAMFIILTMLKMLRGKAMQGMVMEMLLPMLILLPQASTPRLEENQTLAQVRTRGLGKGLPSRGEGGTYALGKGGPAGPSQGGVPVFTVGGVTPEWCGGPVIRAAPCELGGPSIRGKVTPSHVLALFPKAEDGEVVEPLGAIAHRSFGEESLLPLSQAEALEVAQPDPNDCWVDSAPTVERVCKGEAAGTQVNPSVSTELLPAGCPPEGAPGELLEGWVEPPLPHSWGGTSTHVITAWLAGLGPEALVPLAPGTPVDLKLPGPLACTSAMGACSSQPRLRGEVIPQDPEGTSLGSEVVDLLALRTPEWLEPPNPMVQRTTGEVCKSLLAVSPEAVPLRPEASVWCPEALVPLAPGSSGELKLPSPPALKAAVGDLFSKYPSGTGGNLQPPSRWCPTLRDSDPLGGEVPRSLDLPDFPALEADSSPEKVLSGFQPKGPLCVQDYASYGEIGTVLSLQCKGGQEWLWGTYSRSIIV